MQPIRPSDVRIATGLGTSTAPVSQAALGRAIPVLHIDAGSVTDPNELVRILSQLATILRGVQLVAGTNPLANSVLLKNVTTVSGSTVTLDHHLGRPVSGWTVLRPRTASWAGYELAPQPAGIDAQRQIQLHADATGMFDFLFF